MEMLLRFESHKFCFKMFNFSNKTFPMKHNILMQIWRISKIWSLWVKISKILSNYQICKGLSRAVLGRHGDMEIWKFGELWNLSIQLNTGRFQVGPITQCVVICKNFGFIKISKVFAVNLRLVIDAIKVAYDFLKRTMTYLPQIETTVQALKSITKLLLSRKTYLKTE